MSPLFKVEIRAWDAALTQQKHSSWETGWACSDGAASCREGNTEMKAQRERGAAVLGAVG